MRVGAVDLGTNSTRLLVADVDDGRVDEVLRRLTITRLGEGVDGRRRLLPVPIARVRNVLADYRREAEALGAERVLAVGTSAIRDAENGEAFLGEIEWSYGFATRLVSGDEEAALTFRGVAAGREAATSCFVIDIGGGSTELVAGDETGVTARATVDMGCVRQTERHLYSDPPTEGELDACAAAVRALLAEHVAAEAAAGTETVIGVAGTVTSLAALDLGLADYDAERVHGHRLRRDAVDAQLVRLAALPVAERRRVAALEPERAPVIVAGAVILRELLDYFAIDALEASERDILHGIALEAAALPERAEAAAPPGAYTCC